jgi:hypothetical protein
VAFWRRLIFEEKKGRRLISEKKDGFSSKKQPIQRGLFWSQAEISKFTEESGGRRLECLNPVGAKFSALSDMQMGYCIIVLHAPSWSRPLGVEHAQAVVSNVL